MILVKKRVLVTGSDGFIGRHLVRRLEKEEAEVKVLDSRKDIRRWNEVKNLVKTAKGIDIVFHLAAFTYIPFCWKNPRVTYETNVLGTLNTLELCRLCQVKKLVFMSSYVYGVPKYLPVDENHPVEPTNPYSKSKKLAEELCKTYYDDYGLNTVILRPFNVYGEGQSSNFLIPSIVQQVLKNKEVRLKDPAPKRDFLYIADMVDVFLKASLYEGRGWEIFNIGAGKSYSVREIVAKLIKIHGKKVNVVYNEEERKGEIMDVVADISKAKKELDWQPETRIEEGLRIYLQRTNSSV